jgi:hypothetical protein
VAEFGNLCTENQAGNAIVILRGKTTEMSAQIGYAISLSQKNISSYYLNHQKWL